MIAMKSVCTAVKRAAAPTYIHGRYPGKKWSVDLSPIPVNTMIDVQASAVNPTALVLHSLVGAHTTATQAATYAASPAE
jgi:hypothetical protein